MLIKLCACGDPYAFRLWEETGVPCVWGRGRVAPLAFSLALLFDQPGAQCHPSEDSTCLYLCPLCQSLVGLIVVEADGVPFPVNPAHSTESILRMPDHCPS